MQLMISGKLAIIAFLALTPAGCSTVQNCFLLADPDEAHHANSAGNYEGMPSAFIQCEAKNGNQRAQYALGTIASEEREFKKAAKWYRRASLRQDGTTYMYIPPDGIYPSGSMDRTSYGVDSEGIAEAQYALALLYVEGNGVAQSSRKARKWLKRAAKQGHNEATRLLEILEVD